MEDILATTYGMHAPTFALHSLNHVHAISMFSHNTVSFNLIVIHTASFKPLHPHSCMHTSSHSRSSGCKQHLEVSVQKKPKDQPDGVTVRVSIEI